MRTLRPRKGACPGPHSYGQVVGTQRRSPGSQLSGLSMVCPGLSLCVFITFAHTEPQGFYTSPNVLSFSHFLAISSGTQAAVSHRVSSNAHVL